MRGWHEKFGSEDFTIIANHYPEFSYEEDFDNLKKAIEELNVPYPVVQDNDGRIWRAYKNRYWPTLYLIGKRGNIRYQHIGEGAEQETEAAILSLLSEPYP